MDIREYLGSIFSTVLAEVIRTVSGFWLAIKPLGHDTAADEEKITSMMRLRGSINGAVILSAAPSDIKIICSSMIGVPLEEVTSEDIEDTLRELVNMTAGGAKLRLSDTDFAFALAPPFIAKEEDLDYIASMEDQSCTIALGNESIAITLQVAYQEAHGG